MKVFEWLKKVGDVFKKAGQVIESVVGEQTLLVAVSYVEAAAARELTNPEKAVWAEGKLKNHFPGLSDTAATAAVHIGLLLVKRGIEAAAENAAEQIQQ
jgi:hypothetical protein